MPLVTMRQLLDEAAAGGYGVAAFNVNNLEQIQGIMDAAQETQSPVIVQASRGARKYAGDHFLYHMMLAAAETYPDIPVALHQDHGNSPETCISAIELGFTSVMMDGSLGEDAKTPLDFEDNVAVTKKVVDYAHARGVTVEGELGTLGGMEDGVGSGEICLTDPAQAEEFVERTGVDALAVAIGTSHGAYKFSRAPDGDILAIKMKRQEYKGGPTKAKDKTRKRRKIEELKRARRLVNKKKNKREKTDQRNNGTEKTEENKARGENNERK